MKKEFILFSEFEVHIEDWLQLRVNLGHQPSSVESGRKDINVFCRFCNEYGIQRIYGRTVTEYVHWLKSVRNNGSGAINRKRSSLKGYINHLRLKQVKGALVFPIEYLPRARVPYCGPIKTLEPDEVKLVIKAFNTTSVIGFRDFTFFNMQYALGLRIGEVVKIDLKDIDWRKKVITIHGKGRRERELPLVRPVIKILKRWLEYRVRFLNSDKSPALFLSKKGNRISQRTVQEKFQMVISKVGQLSLDRVVPHTLRHAYASHALETEKDLLVIKHILGHASLKSTEIYLHPSMRQLKASVDNHIACDMLASFKIKVIGRVEIKKFLPSAA